MDPLITNGIDPALLRVLEKRGQDRDPVLRRRRPAGPVQQSNSNNNEDTDEELLNQATGADAPKHVVDDLA